NEFTQLRIVRSRCRSNLGLGESFRFRISIGIKNRHRQLIVAGPETQATDLLRVGFTSDRVRQMRYSARMWRRRTAGKPGYSQIETAPEKMHRAAFAAKVRSKFFEHPLALQKHAPKSICVFGIIGSVFLITLKRNRIHDLVWCGVDFDSDAKLAQCFHDGAIKRCHALGLKLQHLETAVVSDDSQFV